MLEARNFFFEARLFSAPIAFSLLSTLFFPISRHFSCRGESFVRAVNTCARASTPPFRARRDSFLFLDFFGVSFRLFLFFNSFSPDWIGQHPSATRAENA